MRDIDVRLAYVGRRAYELARSGYHEDFASIQRAIMKEGYADCVPWLERDGVMASLAEICAITQANAADGVAARAPGHQSGQSASASSF